MIRYGFTERQQEFIIRAKSLDWAIGRIAHEIRRQDQSFESCFECVHFFLAYYERAKVLTEGFMDELERA